MNATHFMGDPESDGGPPLNAVLRRLTLDLNTREIIGDIEVGKNTSREVLEGNLPGAPRDVLVYLFHTSADPPSLNQIGYGKRQSETDCYIADTWASAMGDDI
eukprot:12736201-Prorocentrum_lima.AAC.1